ncbi:lipoprotein [Salmonella enterica subsp. enterica serovar Typhimurium]|nr:lipoprotein [Salmonella enterica subsp. enterica serovar Typhimurium]
MSEREIRSQLEKGDSLAFEKTALYKKVYNWPRPKRARRLRGKCCPVFNWKVRRSHAS